MYVVIGYMLSEWVKGKVTKTVNGESRNAWKQMGFPYTLESERFVSIPFLIVIEVIKVYISRLSSTSFPQLFFNHIFLMFQRFASKIYVHLQLRLSR